MDNANGMGITKNIKLIEWLKTEILKSISELYQILFKGSKDSGQAVTDTIANNILVSYLLARRLGITFTDIDNKIEEKIKIGITDQHEIERWYRDLSELSGHLNRNRE